MENGKLKIESEKLTQWKEVKSVQWNVESEEAMNRIQTFLFRFLLSG